MEDLKTLMARQEELATELRFAVCQNSMGGEMISHPLVQSIFYIPQQNAMYNAQLKAKKEALAQASKSQRWSEYLWLYERPYRFDAFKGIASKLEPNEYWDTLSMLWSDSENIWQNLNGWKQLLNAKIPKRHLMMSSHEEHYFKNFIPDMVEIHRGYQEGKNKHGFSFSLDKKKALWFANRFNKGGKVLTLTVPKKDLVAYIDSRGEKEIIYLGK